MKTKTEVKVLALEQFLKETGDFTAKDEEQDIIATCEEYIEDGDYLVYTDGEADEAAADYIKESVWAFKKSFLNFHSEAIAEIDDKSFAKLQEGGESINKALWAMIDDKEHFIKHAINADGRGHFLSPYDGEENEVKINGEYYFIYRQN